MEGETRVVSENSRLTNAQPISVLVVDDDITCLAIVAAKLKKFQYHVAAVKHPNEALCTLRVKVDAFDLVVSDVHMPDLSGIQLQQVIAREFNLPVVLMSTDKKEDVVLEGLESGATFYIAKPVSTDDLKDLWQFAVTKKKKSQVVIEETWSLTHEMMISSNKTTNSDTVAVAESSMMIEIAGSTSSVDKIIHEHNKDSKRKSPQKEESSGKSREISETASQKKQKVIWTSSLHNRFLEAIRSIGFDRAVPKKIIEVMNVPSLTRENVASHLQKYRIFLRRVTEEANLKLQCAEKLSSSKTFLPKFTPLSRPSSSSLFLNSLTRMHDPNSQTFLGAKNAFFLNREGSSRDILSQSGFGQSRLLSNGGSMLNPKVVGTNRTTENESTRIVRNFYQNISPVQGNISGAFSPHFNPLVLDSMPGVNLEIVDYGSSNSYINDGIINPNFNSLSSTTSKDSAIQTNFEGLNISNVQHLLAKSAGKQRACDGRINNLATSLEFQNSTTAGIVLRPNESPAIKVDQMTGDQLFDDFLAEECQMLMHSNVHKVMGNVENGLGESSYDHSTAYSYSPMFDLDELTSLPLDQECNLSPNIPTSTDQVQNQVQGFDNVSFFDQVVNIQNQEFDNVTLFDQVLNIQNQVQYFDNVSSFDQVVNVQNQVQPDEDAFLESLLGLFEENYSIEGL